MLNTSEITSIDIELSTHCNARCPECVRNFRGWNIVNFPKQNLDIEKYNAIINQLPCLQDIILCGNYGDPLMHPDICDFISDKYNYMIFTNGSIGKINTFVELARSNVEIVCGIDGLADTNSIYRQDVDWNKLMHRVSAFIEAGGNATWQFIIFKHNEHQIEQAHALSKELGFRTFDARNDNRNNGPILDNTGNQIGFLEPHDRTIKKDYDINFELSLFKNPVTIDTDYSNYNISCQTLQQGRIYMNAMGEIRPCCYFGAMSYDEHKPIGKTLQEQMNNYQYIADAWNTKNCFEKCGEECGNAHI